MLFMKDLVHDLLTLLFLLEGFFVLVIPGTVADLVRSGFLLLLGLGGDGGLGGLGGSGGLVAPTRTTPGLILGLPSCLPASRIFFARFMAAFL
jgi:hypothetical protein